MLPEDKPQFVAHMARISAGVYGKEISTVSLDIYWEMLERFTLQAVKDGLNKHVADKERCRFMPIPGDVIYQIEGMLQPLLAWTKVLQAIQIHGSYQSIVFDDPIIHIVINEMRGWIRLCEQPESQLPFYQREFERRYQHYYRNPPAYYPRELSGRTNHHNERLGYSRAALCFCGDKLLAEQIYKTGVEPAELISRSTGTLDVKQLGTMIPRHLTPPTENTSPLSLSHWMDPHSTSQPLSPSLNRGEN